MSIQKLEQIVENAYGGLNSGKQSTEELDNLRKAPDRWSVGIQLFSSSSTPVARFFALSLIREFLASSIGIISIKDLSEIRNWLLKWLSENTDRMNSHESFVLNNLISITVQTLKLGFPEVWPSAFDDLFSFGERNIYCLDFLVRVFLEIDTEVIMFHSDRGTEEISHNNLIKDAIREGKIAQDTVRFLCNSAISAKPIDCKLSSRCLKALATFVGWIDLGLIVNSPALNLLYQALQDQELFASSCACLLEVVRKGMDPLAKMKMIQNCNLVPVLFAIQLPDDTFEALSDPETPGSVDDSDSPWEALATLVDALIIELLSCCSLQANNIGSSTDVVSTVETEQASAEALRLVVPMMLRLFVRSSDCATCVLESFNALVATMKAQVRQPLIGVSVGTDTAPQPPPFAFSASEFLDDFLRAIFIRMEFPDDFEFDADDEADVEELEFRKEIRKLFVNISRIFPDQCLRLLFSAFESMAKPLSSAPFSPLDAALRLLHAIGECGPAHIAKLSEYRLPSLLKALHESDVGAHAHSEVLLTYFELSSRYASISDTEDLRRVVAYMTGASGLRSESPKLRSRCAYFLLKLCESLGTRAVVLLSSVRAFSDLLLNDPDVVGPLPEQAETYLVEAIALMTVAIPPSSKNSDNPMEEAAQRELIQRDQRELLCNLTSTLLQQLSTYLAHPHLLRYSDQIAPGVSQKLACLASLTRPFSYKITAHLHAIPIFEPIVGGLEATLNVLGEFALVRSKAVSLQHRLISCLGQGSLRSVGICLKALFSGNAEGELDSAIMLLNKVMAEFLNLSLPIVDEFLGITVKLWTESYRDSCESELRSSNSHSTAPHFAVERDALLKLFFLLLQHIGDFRCVGSLCSERNYAIFQTILSIIVAGVDPKLTNTPIDISIQVRRGAVAACSALLKGLHAASGDLDYGTGYHRSLEIRTAFLTCFSERILPALIRSLGDGSLDTSDAVSVAFIGDIAAVLWIFRELKPLSESTLYLANILSSLQWPSEAVQETLRLFQDGEPAKSNSTAFRDAFKKLIRSYVTGGNKKNCG